jgi:hypothetical protein
MNYSEFKNQWLGKRIDYDSLYGWQCVDIIKQWLDSGFSIKPGAWGNAIDYWRSTNPGVLIAFKKVTNTPDYIPPQGSIVIFNATSSNKYGHIAIVDSATKTVLNILEQNGGAGTGTGTGVDAIRLRNPGYNNIAGFLEPINNKGKEQVADQIILNADNWFNRCNKTIKFTRGREMSREEFAPQVGRKFINFVEDAEDFPEADEQLRRIEIGRANTVVDTDDWYNFTNKLMVAARGRKWGSREEFRIQVNRPFNATASDIFSGEEYDNHQKKILNLATENATLKTENATLKAQANSGGINQDTVNTINETNSIVKSILSIVTNIWNAITRLWRV